MRVLWIFAHPEPRSLNGALRAEGLRALEEAGHTVRQSDLYAMGWKAVVDRDDFPDARPGPLAVADQSRRSYDAGTLREDILAEHDKLDWADAVVVQFPLWWYGMPAILKGWFDRVFVEGYGYGVRDPERPGRTLRYGAGKLAGTRALVVTSSGSPELPLGPRGINGQLDHVLFPLLHGTLWYVGMTVLPPIVVHGADRMDSTRYSTEAARLRQRVLSLADTAPLPFRSQNGGDYDDDLVLRPERAPGRTGLDVHYAETSHPITAG